MEQGAFRGGLCGSRLVALTTAAVLVLGACGAAEQEPEPPPPPPVETVEPTPEPEPEVEPEVTEPTHPWPEGVPGPREAEQAAVYFLELYHYVMQTGDLEAWNRAVTGPECAFCVGTIEAADEIHSVGGAYVSEGLAVGEPRFLAFDETFRMFAIEVPFDFAGAVVLDVAGDEVRAVEPLSAYMILDIAFAADRGWLLLTGSRHEEPFE